LIAVSSPLNSITALCMKGNNLQTVTRSRKKC